MISSPGRNGVPRTRANCSNSRRIIKARPAVTPPRSRPIHRADFEKPSLRTRVTFDVGIQSMGGSVVFLDHTQASASLARGSPSPMSLATSSAGAGHRRARYHQRVLEEMAANTASRGPTRFPTSSSLPGACRFFYTGRKIRRLARLQARIRRRRHNVCHSLIYLAARLGVHLRVATPAEYTPLLKLSRWQARGPRNQIQNRIDDRPPRGRQRRNGVYTDSWTSMGFEAEGQVRNSVFQPYQVNAELMSLAARTPFFMHCLPAHRGLEVTRNPRRPAVGRPRSIRKPHVRSESHPAYLF